MIEGEEGSVDPYVVQKARILVAATEGAIGAELAGVGGGEGAAGIDGGERAADGAGRELGEGHGGHEGEDQEGGAHGVPRRRACVS